MSDTSNDIAIVIAVSWSDRLQNWDDDLDKGLLMGRKFVAELFGTAVLVFFAAGVATLMFVFKFDGGSVAAGVPATALTFDLVLLSPWPTRLGRSRGVT